MRAFLFIASLRQRKRDARELALAANAARADKADLDKQIRGLSE